jgi:hypothetical protein
MFIVDPPTANGPRDHTGDYGVLQIWGERRQSYIQKTAFSGNLDKQPLSHQGRLQILSI